jgi:hypothetical protein
MDAPDVLGLVRPEWPPLRHVRHGWAALTETERADVQRRVEAVLAQHRWGPHHKDALLHFMTFLAQVETVAIEIPMRFLPHAPADLRPMLQRQLVDEVFHSTLFARLAHELALPNAQPPAPLASAERLLDRIRHEPDLAVCATLLNLVAEGWIETLFRHALDWQVSDAVFRAVLADEERHVHEAQRYMQSVDKAKAQAAVDMFEQGMSEVSSEPTVALSILDLAGPQKHRALATALDAQHRRALAEVGLHPSAEWERMSALATDLQGQEPPSPTRVADSAWRTLARRVWVTPRDPTMQGDFDVAVGHVPRKILTPVIIAAIGRAWSAHPQLNRVVARDGVWQLPAANVGVRVLLEDDELATVVIPEADRRSVRDIRRMLLDGIEQLRSNRQEIARRGVTAAQDPEVSALVPPAAHMFSVAISNAGKWGVVSGAGSFSGWVSPSTDFTIGLRRRLPRWRGVAYWPSWHVNVAAIQDHRVFDGRASSVTVTAMQAALSPSGVRAILRTPDTIAPFAEQVRNEVLRGSAVPAAAALSGLALPKYAPVAIGGLGIGAAAGYLIYRYMQSPPMPPLRQPPPVPPRTEAAPSTDLERSEDEPTFESGKRPRGKPR